MSKQQKSHIFSKHKGFRVFGIGRQDAIKYFFGGNATISIIVLLLICIFLAKEALLFFPDYRRNLEIYRKSGQEYATLADDQLEYQKLVKGLVTQAKAYELYGRAGYDAEVYGIFIKMQNITRELMKAPLEELKLAIQVKESREKLWAIVGVDAEEKKKLEANVKAKQRVVNEKVKEISKLVTIDKLDEEFQRHAKNLISEYPTAMESLQADLVFYYTDYDGKEKNPPFVTERNNHGKKVREALMKEPLFQSLEQVEKTIGGSIPDYSSFVKDIRAKTLAVKLRAASFATAAAREKAIKEGMPNATPERRAELEVDLERIIKTGQNYGELAERVYATLPEYKKRSKAMISTSQKAFKNLPDADAFEIAEAQLRFAKLQKMLDGYEKFMERKGDLMEEWRYDKKVGYSKAIFGFFFGKKWVTNSSWNDFFGLGPLFGGSLFITLIAVALATPFAIGSAIYVNRLASKTEQNIVKPVIEFIQAIPSVVLAFLGLMVVGKAIVKYSNSWLFDWLPGFPVSQESMMLTAGILLAFMAIPTMFTLAEDALNNVPKSYYEASLALGASKLQTILKVIVPCSLSGVVAAVLLGFGRIIGETMVVLLVAGGRIAWPTSWVDPVHTMTGIIAQETGEAPVGSIQYKALFLVGLVLFFISLLLNSLAQRVIKKYGSKAI